MCSTTTLLLDAQKGTILDQTRSDMGSVFIGTCITLYQQIKQIFDPHNNFYSLHLNRGYCVS